MNARGRPRKTPEKLLIERVSVLLTERDRELLQRIADHKGMAPQTLLRVLVLPAVRDGYREIFGAA